MSAANLRSSSVTATLGFVVAAVGLALLGAIGAGIYTARWSRVLEQAGIPAVLLAELVGIAALFTGAALIAGVVMAHRRSR